MAERAGGEVVGRLVHYSGRVQGVGFRATAAAIARSYDVTGWVRNLPDGRVQLLVEGPAEEVERFLGSIQSRWGRYIDSIETESRPASGLYHDFEIVR